MVAVKHHDDDPVLWKDFGPVARRQVRLRGFNLFAFACVVAAFVVFGGVQQHVHHGDIAKLRAEVNARVALEHRQNRAAAMRLEADREEACKQSNVAQQQAIAASDAHDLIEANAISPPPRSAGAEAAVERALGAEHNAALSGHPFRDCTPAGIARYLGETPPTTGAP